MYLTIRSVASVLLIRIKAESSDGQNPSGDGRLAPLTVVVESLQPPENQNIVVRSSNAAGFGSSLRVFIDKAHQVSLTVLICVKTQGH